MAKTTAAPKEDKTQTETVDPAKQAEEMKKLAEGVSETLFGKRRDTRVKPSETPPVDAPKTGMEAQPEVTPPASDKKPETAPAAQPQPRAAKPADDKKDKTEEVISRTARATAEEVTRNLRKPEAETETETVATSPESQLSDEDRSDYEGFKKLEEMNPGRKGIAERYLGFVNDRAEYQANWQKENPGKEFNPESDEHDDFWAKYKEFDSPRTAEELEEAKIEIKIDKRMEARFKPMEEQRRLESVRAQVRPLIAKQVIGQVQTLANMVSPELAKKMLDDKGNFKMTADDIKKLEEDYPVEIPILMEIIDGKRDHRGQIIPQTSLLNMLQVIEQLPYAEHTGFRLNPNDPVHGRVLDYISEYERFMENAPPDVKFQQLNGENGQKLLKSFITAADLVELQNQIYQSKVSQRTKDKKLKELDDKYWTVGPDAIEKLLLDDVSKAAKLQIERVNSLADKRAGKLTPPKTFSAPVVVPQPAPRIEKPNPPSLQSGDVVATGDTSTPESKKLAESVGNRLFSTT